MLFKFQINEIVIKCDIKFLSCSDAAVQSVS